MNYLVLLTDSLLSVIPNDGRLPEEFTKHFEALHSFSTLSDAFSFIGKELSFDDIYEFGAEYGLDYQNRKIYYRNPHNKKN